MSNGNWIDEETYESINTLPMIFNYTKPAEEPLEVAIAFASDAKQNMHYIRFLVLECNQRPEQTEQFSLERSPHLVLSGKTIEIHRSDGSGVSSLRCSSRWELNGNNPLINEEITKSIFNYAQHLISKSKS